MHLALLLLAAPTFQDVTAPPVPPEVATPVVPAPVVPAPVVPAPAVASIDPEALEAVVDPHDGEDRPGFTAALCRDGEVLWVRGVGRASLEWDVPNDRDTVFRLASTSKQFTAAAIHMLAQEGTISLDEPLATYLPAFADVSPMPTVRQMIHHTSGLRDYLNLMLLMGYDLDGRFELDEILAVLQRQRGLNFAPGTDFSYSNTNYCLMALIVEAASGQDLAAFTRERLFEPLGMTATTWLDDHKRVVPRRAWGYMPKGDGFERSETDLEVLGDGALASTVGDLARWADVLVDPPEAWRPLVDDLLVPGRVNGEPIDYAAGLMVDTWRGLPRIHHGGAFVGFRAQMMHLPEQNLTAICLANRGDFNPDGICHDLLAAALGDTLPPEPKPVVEATPAEAKPSTTLDRERRRAPNAEEAEAFAGTWRCEEIDMTWHLEVSAKGRLVVRRDDGRTSRVRVRRGEDGTITHAVVVGMKVDFTYDGEGRVTGGTLDAGRARGMRLERMPAEPQPPEDGTPPAQRPDD